MTAYIHNMGLRFKAVARECAVRTALSFGDGRQLNYAELDELSDKAATHLLRTGLGPGNVVAIYAEKSALTYSVMIAALKIGAPYVVLDTQSPVERIDKILRCCRPALLVVDRAFRWGDAATLPLAAVGGHAEPLSESIVRDVRGSVPAYLMFTSGSTGFPKGVAISHASMLNFCTWTRETFHIETTDVLSGVNALYFDNSVFDFTASLFNGACLRPVDRDSVIQPKLLVAQVKDCTIWFSVPSLLIYLMTLKALDSESWQQMRAIIFGGEGFPKAMLRKLYTLQGARAALWNVYGPTECTCICSAYRVDEEDFGDMGKLAPLGHLAPNFTGAVMDESGTREVAAGEVGELFLIGPQVALGYYNDPQRSREAFAPSPLTAAIAEPCYRTGDLVWRDPATGYYHFAGRKDNQIKHMGFRVELEEIEAALEGLPEVTQAVVIYHKSASFGGRLVAFVNSRAGVVADSLKARLRDLLPSYMIPEEIHARENFPMHANGKVDRKSLATKYGAEHG
jgi:D-alanine--poly(phosphoribitol) ligase subunit 1